MIVKTSLRHRGLLLTHHRINVGLGLVLGRVKHHVAHVFYVLKRLSPSYVFVVVALGLVVVEEFRGYKGVSLYTAGEQLGIGLHKHVLVNQLGAEYVSRFLYVGNTRLPEQIKQVDAFNAYVSETVKLIFIPYHLVYGGAALHLAPHSVIVRGLEVILLEYAGDDGGKHSRLTLVGCLTGQYVRLGVSLNSVGVLRRDHVVKPSGL